MTRLAGPGGVDAAILACVRLIPPAAVMTYGDVAEYVGTRSARTVGRVLAGSDEDHHGLPWHRVVRADGTCAEPVRDEQLQRLRREGVPFDRRGRVDLAAARWDGRSRSPRRRRGVRAPVPSPG